MANKLQTLKTLIESQTKTQNVNFNCNESIVNTRLQEINTHKQIDRLFNSLDNINKQLLTFKN